MNDSNRLIISHQAFLDPQQNAAVIKAMSEFILSPDDLYRCAQLMASSLLQAQVTAPDGADEYLEHNRVLGGTLASKDNRSSPSIGAFLRCLANVSQYAGLKQDSEIIKAPTGIVVKAIIKPA